MSQTSLLPSNSFGVLLLVELGKTRMIGMYFCIYLCVMLTLDSPVGFVEFEDNESATRARDSMADHRFARGDRGISVQFSNPSRSSKRSRSDTDSYSHYSSSSHNSYSQPPPPYGGGGYYGGYGGYGSAPPSYMYNSLPAEASSTLFVEGLPSDVTVREVSHIFRPFPGYQSLRIVPKESKADPAKVFTLCFVEYDSKYVPPCRL